MFNSTVRHVTCTESRLELLVLVRRHSDPVLLTNGQICYSDIRLSSVHCPVVRVHCDILSGDAFDGDVDAGAVVKLVWPVDDG